MFSHPVLETFCNLDSWEVRAAGDQRQRSEKAQLKMRNRSLRKSDIVATQHVDDAFSVLALDVMALSLICGCMRLRRGRSKPQIRLTQATTA